MQLSSECVPPGVKLLKLPLQSVAYLFLQEFRSGFIFGYFLLLVFDRAPGLHLQVIHLLLEVQNSDFHVLECSELGQTENLMSLFLEEVFLVVDHPFL